MEKQKIINFLKENEIEDIEEIKYKEQVAVFRFYYDFDDDELDAARSYSNDECDGESEGEIWYEEFFLPYLNDLAVDNVGEILEEAIDELNIGIQYISYNVDKDNVDYSEFIAVFYDKDNDVKIETVLDDLKL